jgi:hypothetical protein
MNRLKIYICLNYMWSLHVCVLVSLLRVAHKKPTQSTCQHHTMMLCKYTSKGQWSLLCNNSPIHLHTCGPSGFHDLLGSSRWNLVGPDVQIHELFMPASWASRSVVRLLCHGDWPGKHQHPDSVQIRRISQAKIVRRSHWCMWNQWKKPLRGVYRLCYC